MKAANDNKPKQIELPKWLVWDGVVFPSDEAWEYIEHDFHHGMGYGNELPVGGTVMEFLTTRGRAVFAAIVPDVVEYDVDWNAVHVEPSEPHSVLEWHAEWYASSDDATVALKIASEKVDHIANDDDGTYGIEGEYDGGAVGYVSAA